MILCFHLSCKKKKKKYCASISTVFVSILQVTMSTDKMIICYKYNFCETDERKKKKKNRPQQQQQINRNNNEDKNASNNINFVVSLHRSLCVIQWKDVFSFRSYSWVLSLCYNLDARTHFSFIRIHWCVDLATADTHEKKTKKKTHRRKNYVENNKLRKRNKKKRWEARWNLNHNKRNEIFVLWPEPSPFYLVGLIIQSCANQKRSSFIKLKRSTTIDSVWWKNLN